ncbi:cupredoxin domain-containing protein [Pseudogemmatithrix spongiicola]|uniref:Cupredoxin domain-containing protein n=1 Tax=Pseudogemmatithrix spongiicola TaxID=3062599 RepID=A0AA49JWN0_9BACT|nr:cupredoxin domain-containing protein [Gemmatimonadaceae bacterium 'strain 138']WKW16324.1 cupredoxin domain-containing protein [Gemmatimonadaceae bacterium 'strain 318']
MSATDWTVILAAVLAIAAVNWWFFVAGQSPAAAVVAESGGPAEVVITVDGGYSPAVVQVRKGERVRLVFDRKDTSSCSEEVVIPAFDVRQFLPSGERTVIEIQPTEAGRFPFTCGMSMLRGSIIVDG